MQDALLEEIKNLAVEYMGKGAFADSENKAKNRRTQMLESGNMLGLVGNTLHSDYFGEVGLDQSTIYKNLTTRSGNDNFDRVIKERLGMYAAYAGAKADGNVTVQEIGKFMAAVENQNSKEAKAFSKAYESGDREVFINSLEALLTKLFGNLTVTESNP